MFLLYSSQEKKQTTQAHIQTKPNREKRRGRGKNHPPTNLFFKEKAREAGTLVSDRPKLEFWLQNSLAIGLGKMTTFPRPFSHLSISDIYPFRVKGLKEKNRSKGLGT